MLFKKEWLLFESENSSVKPNNPHIHERFATFVQFLSHMKINITVPMSFSFFYGIFQLDLNNKKIANK